MEFSGMLPIICIFALNIFVFIMDRKNKLIFASKIKYGIMMPTIVGVYLIMTVETKNLMLQDIILLIEIIPLAFFGNKRGLTTNGILTGANVTTWDKIESYTLEEQENKYILHYKTNSKSRKMIFRENDKEEIKKYLSGIKKLKYVRK